MKKAATIISILGHPLLTIPLFVLAVMFGSEEFTKASRFSFLIIGCIFFPIIAWMYFRSRRGSYTNFDVSDQKQRRSLFLFAIPLLAIVSVFLFASGQRGNLFVSVLFALMLLVLSQITNFFIKSSLHVSLNIFLSALIFTVNHTIGIVALLSTGLLGWSRVELGRHTLKEVLIGLLIGLVISLVMLKAEGYI
jgi:hypothetical protein